MKTTLLSLVLGLALALAARAGDLTITFSVPDGLEEVYIAKVAAAKGWQPTIFDPTTLSRVANPEPQLAFIKRRLGEELIAAVGAAAIKAASDAAAATAKAANDQAAALIQVR